MLKNKKCAHAAFRLGVGRKNRRQIRKLKKFPEIGRDESTDALGTDFSRLSSGR